MSTYIALIRYIGLVTYSEKGVKMTKDISARLEQTAAALQATGAKVVSSHLTIGRYDAVVTLETDNPDVAARLGDVAKSASVRIELLRGLSDKDLAKVLALPM